MANLPTCDRCEKQIADNETYWQLPPGYPQGWENLCDVCHKVWMYNTGRDGGDVKSVGLSPKPRDCFDCQHCGMDMDMDPYCAHPDVLKTNPSGSNTNVVRGGIPEPDDRRNLPHFALCGPNAALFELRKTT